jgi:putative acetyltransferase
VTETIDAVVIRPMQPEDLPGIAEMARLPGCIYNTLRLPFDSDARLHARFQQRSPADMLLVAALGGRVAGQIGLRPDVGRRSHAGELGMMVRDDCQGRGIGRKLLAAVVDLADNWLRLERLELGVFHDNDRAVALYESFGFEREGVLRAYAFRDGAYVDSIAMARLRLRG